MSMVEQTQQPNANGALTRNDTPAPQKLVIRDTGAFANLLDTARFEHLWRVSSAFAKSDMVPQHFRGKPENCFIATQMAVRLGVDPFMFMQNCYIVHGRPGLEAKLAIALANSAGVFRDRIKYAFEGEGKNRRCRAYAHDKDTGEELSAEVTWTMVEAEGWNKDAKTRDGTIIKSKWNTLPDVMFRYRAATFLIRLYCPEVLMGMQTADELEETVVNVESQLAAPIDVPTVGSKSAHLAAMLEHKPAETFTPQTEPEKESVEVPQEQDETTIPAEEDINQRVAEVVEEFRLKLEEAGTILECQGESDRAQDFAAKNPWFAGEPVDVVKTMAKARADKIRGSRGQRGGNGQ